MIRHLLFLILWVIVLGIILNSCSIYTSRLEADIPRPDYKFQHLPEKTAPPVEKWWEYFNEPQLNHLMEEMFSHNLEIEEALARWQRFQAEFLITDADRKPAINIFATAQRQRIPSPSESFSSFSSSIFDGSGENPSLPQSINGEGSDFTFDPVTENSYRLSAPASYELDLWNKLKARSQADAWELLATEADIQSLYLSLAAETAEMYFRIIEIKHRLILLDITLESLREALNVVEARYLQGLVTSLDVYQAERNLAGIIVQRPQLEQELALAQYALSLILGRPPQIRIGGTRDVLPEAPSPLPVDLPSGILKQRPDVQGALHRLRAADNRLAAAIADRFPSFNLSADIGYTASKIHDLFSSEKFFWNLIGDITQPLIDGGRRKAEIEKRKALYLELISRYHHIALRAFKEVEDTLVKNQKNDLRMSYQKKLVDASKHVLDTSILNYLQGLNDYLPVLDAQQRYYQARQNLIGIRGQVFSDRIELARVIGGNWPQTLLHQRLETIQKKH